MKIKIINPAVGIPAEYSERSERYLRSWLRPDTLIEFEDIAHGFGTVETETQDIVNGAETLKLIYRLRDSDYDCIFVNCFDDPGVLAAREFSRVPVLGPYEPSIAFASLLAERIAIISTDSYGLLCEERKSRKHHRAQLITRVMNVGLTVSELDDDALLVKRLLECCEELAEEQIGAAVLGCTGMGHIVDELTERLLEKGSDIRIVEPLRTGVTMLEHMIHQGCHNLIRSTDIGAFPE